MHNYRFYLNPAEISGEWVRFSRPESHHMSSVLRLRTGSEVEAVDGRGNLYLVRLTQQDAGCWAGQILHSETVEFQAPLKILLALPCLKQDRWETALEAAAEMGVQEIWLTDYRLASAPWNSTRRTRAERKVVEALKQCGGSRAAEVLGPCTLEELLAQRRAFPACLADADGGPLPERLPSPVLLVIGPEAGLHSDEMKLLEERSVHRFSLGKRRLRSEIAVIAALAQVAPKLAE